jgi:hypothetical protein
MSEPFPPPEALSSVLVPHSTITIQAPASIVWSVMLDPSTWPDWNVFVPKCTRVSGEEVSGSIKAGDTLRFHVSMPPGPKNPNGKRSPNTTDVQVNTIQEPAAGDDPKVYYAQWTRMGDWTLPSAALKCVRRLFVEVKGDSECEFRNYETFNGVAAYAVKYLGIGDQIMVAFDEWGNGLKEAAEKRFKESK